MADNLYNTIKAMPKIELHRHLEGSVRLTTLVEIARDHGIEMPEYEVETLRPFVQMMPGEPRSWQNFLGKFRTLRQFYLSPGVIRRITQEVVIDAAEDNVRYMELRFTPRALCNITKCSAHDAVRWVCEAVAETVQAYDIEVRLIVSPNRHESIDVAEAAIQAAIDHMHMGVVGIDLAGIETGYMVYPFRDLFKRGREAGLHVTLHAGEWEGPESVWDAISNVGAERLGHGIRSLEDVGVVNVLVDRGITLEVCPSSNVDSGVVADMAAHQLPQLLEAGIHCTINTDDPLVSGITLTDELLRVVRHMHLTVDDLKAMTLTAAESVFLPDADRRALVRRFQTWLREDVPAN